MRTLVPITLAALLGGACGCQKPDLHKVEGVVTQGGKPVRGGAVFFKPVGEDSKLVISALVMNGGKYSLRTSRGNGVPLPGAPAGEYTVHYMPLPRGDGEKPETIRVPMIATVKPGDNDIPIRVPEP